MIRIVISFFAIVYCFWILVEIIKSLEGKDKKAEETSETEKNIKVIKEVVGILLVLCWYLYTNTTDNKSKSFYIFVAVLFCFIGLFAIFEAKKSNGYMLYYLSCTMVYIEILTGGSFLIQIFGVAYYTKKDQVNPTFLLYLSIVVMILMIVIWCFYFQLSKVKFKNMENIDLINLKTLFLKSIFQSITSFIALYGLASSGLPSVYLTFSLFIDATAAFSYPILDINKYLREKEIEYSEKYAPIKPIKKYAPIKKCKPIKIIKKWYEKGKERTSYLRYKSIAKKFILKKATERDLEAILEYVKKRKADLKNSSSN